MAETPLCAYARAREAKITAGARLTMTVVYKYAPSSAVRAYHEGRGEAPFTYVGVALLVDVAGRSRSLVYEDLKALESAGIIVPATRTVDGREREGWILPLRDDAADLPPAPGGSSGSSEDGQQRRPESARPDTSASGSVRSASARPDKSSAPPDDPPRRTSGPPDKSVRPAGQPSPLGRTAASGPPDRNLCSSSELNGNSSRIVAVEEKVEDRETRARATPAAAAPRGSERSPTARRPVTLVDGEPAGSGLTSARELLRELGMMFVPTDARGQVIRAQRITANDPAALVLAERLLAVPLEGLDEDAARETRRARLQHVLETCREFSELCRREPTKARWWGPGMLDMTVAAGKTLSRWSMVERDVADAQRVAGEAEAKCQARAQETRQAAVEQGEQAELKAATVARMPEVMQRLFGQLGAKLRYGNDRPVADVGLDEERELVDRKKARDAVRQVAALGMSEAEVLARLGLSSVDDLRPVHLQQLRDVRRAVEEARGT